MNKNVKRIIGITLAFSAISAILPVTSTNFLITKVYADSDDENGDTTLDSLILESSSGSTIKLYSDSDYDNGSKLDKDDTPNEDTYFAKTSASVINVKIDGPNSRYVKVFKGTSDSTKGKSISSDISLSSGTTTLVVRVYYNKPDSDIKYEDDSDVASEYKIKVKYTGSDSEEDDSDDYDDIYLDKLSIHGENIQLSESKTTYSYNVSSDIDEVTIKAVPDDEDDDYYTVTIDGEEVDSDDKFKTTVELNKGINEIKVKLEDDDDNCREYTLKINRGNASSGTSSSGNTSTPNTSTNISAVKANQWVQANGKWQYNDSTGNPVKNSWFADKNYGKTYYLQADGTMATGWLYNNGKWYYLGADGAMRTGWILDGGKYYYLYADGTMAYNTIINGYKVGPSGAWIR